MNTTRQRRDQRPVDPSPMQLTARDKEIIRAVHEYRVLKQSQIAALFFGTEAAASRVLIRLFHHRYLDRRLLPVVYGKSPNLYVLDRRGADLLRAEFGLENLVWYPSSKELSLEFLDHSLAINDVRISVVKAASTPEYELREWISETQMKSGYEWVQIRLPSGKSRRVSLIPDSYFVVKTPQGVARLFLELDRGSTSIETFMRKVLAYQSYYASGAYGQRYKAKSMYVVTVTTGEKRLKNLKAVTEKAGGDWRFVFTTADELSKDTVFAAPIWQVSGQTGRSPLFV